MILMLDYEKIDMHCFGCGELIIPFEDPDCVIFFDPGTPDTRVTPGEPASVYLECSKCVNAEDTL
jgi:hypothetical protein